MNEQEWLTSDDPQAMLAYLQHPSDNANPHHLYEPTDRKLRLFDCACCRQVWDQLTDPRSRKAVEVAERYAEGGQKPSQMDWNDLHNAEYGIVLRTLGVTSEFLASRMAAAAMEYDIAAMCMEWATRRTDLVSATVQAALLRDIFGNPFRLIPGLQCAKYQRGVWHETADWLTPTVTALARVAYEERTTLGHLDPARLAVLADALEEAGCREEAMLRHLRGEERYLVMVRPKVNLWGWRPLRGPHVRGCWALDLLLGKE